MNPSSDRIGFRIFFLNVVTVKFTYIGLVDRDDIGDWVQTYS